MSGGLPHTVVCVVPLRLLRKAWFELCDKILDGIDLSITKKIPIPSLQFFRAGDSFPFLVVIDKFVCLKFSEARR